MGSDAEAAGEMRLGRFIFSLGAAVAAACQLPASLRRYAQPPPLPDQLKPLRATSSPPRPAEIPNHGGTQPELCVVAARPRRFRPQQRAHHHLLLLAGVRPQQVGVPLRPQHPRLCYRNPLSTTSSFLPPGRIVLCIKLTWPNFEDFLSSCRWRCGAIMVRHPRAAYECSEIGRAHV